MTVDILEAQCIAIAWRSVYPGVDAYDSKKHSPGSYAIAERTGKEMASFVRAEVEREREACAQICDRASHKLDGKAIALAIRARRTASDGGKETKP